MRVRKQRKKLDLGADCPGFSWDLGAETEAPLYVSSYPLLSERDQDLASGRASASANVPSASCIQSASSSPECEKSETMLPRSYL